MVKIKNNKISITRGDTLETTVAIKTGTGEDYVPLDGDQVRFALKRHYSDKTPLIIKTIPCDTFVLRLEAEETKRLKVGDYVYDIELTTSDGYVDTFIDRAVFEVTEEVY